jgi:hypothetical protein
MKIDHKYKIRLIQTAISEYKAMNDAGDKMNQLFGILSDCKAMLPFWVQFDSYLKVLSELVGDKDKWIEWYIFENDCGKKAFEAGYDKKLKPIKTASQLVQLIEEGIKRNKN